ncbi:hypothetical protein RHMOL_Rhmol03G0258000 [Rhododendron molle]|uniref:Uncharacterized protein n=1 Tax=Rhododendron molle TaxID=49168 RepID=A0ACC0PL16_RHOML|nr:hypothetical protein RHMOL_Rhmol03G0258000 [Rhododendron molle]
MADSNDSISVDMETIYLGGKEHTVRTGQGSVSVIVYGDQDKPALLTYPDLALNRERFVPHFLSRYVMFPRIVLLSRSSFFAAPQLLHLPHQSSWAREFLQLGAAALCPDDPVPSVDDLADQIIEVLNYFRLGAVMCMGVTAGAYVLTLFAMKYRERVLGLILVSPLCKTASWTEWLCNKVMSNLLYFYGMCGLMKELLLHRYFSKEVRGSAEVPESDIVQACRRLLDERQSINVSRFLQAIESSRPDITSGLKTLKCRTLIFVGENSPFHSEAVHMTSKLDRRYSALVEDPTDYVAHTQQKISPGLWIGGNGRATTCDVGTNGVFPHGLRIIQAVPVQRQPKESPQPVVHLPRASLSREHGLKAETYQDSDPYPCQKCIQIIFRKDKDFTIGMYTNSTCVFFSFFGFFLLGRCGGL